MKKYIVSILVASMFMASAPFMVPKASAADMSIRDFINLLIIIGVIPADKIPAVNAYLATLDSTNSTTPAVSNTTTVVSRPSGSSSHYNNTTTQTNTYPIPSCSLTSNKTSYKLGDAITYSWTSQNATYANWQQDTSGKDHLDLPGDKLSANDSQQIIASVIGNPTVTLSIGGLGGVSSCNKTVEVVASPTVTVISPSSGDTLSTGSVATITWEATGGEFDAYQIVVGNTILNTERQLYDRVSMVDYIPSYQKSFPWTVPDLLNDFAKSSSYSFDEIKNSFYLQVKTIKDDQAGGSYVSSSNKINFSINY